ncbi:MAG: hypothetical protein AUK47_18100 [Deltaproteobacteria bacterium CG2_30_63_29]|nr:MAG: hypothetical protein AUK47_18100 [Deltaproteobacteria bacterium CG2_30_63_29]PIW02729.1 MAG: acetolactate synthase [Deltaproteobacteria bacterium CG17_big_fil_post_rev_8_21_14_2_50_63_7]
MTIRLADYIANSLAVHGLHQVFMVTGGGAMHLNDALGHHPNLDVHFFHHEQGAAIAAEGYARVTGRPAVLCVTTGPGGINALNGVFGAWTDSIPMLVISGQVKRSTCMATARTRGLRQLGDQEADAIGFAKGITKFARLVDSPDQIRVVLAEAIHLATSGRPGPCWIDVPIDVQGAQFDPDGLADEPSWEVTESNPHLSVQVTSVLQRFQAAERPVLLPGTGVRLAGAKERFERVARRLGVPIALSWTAVDLVSNDDPLYAGRAGTIGDRAGNFAVQNADLILVLGSRLNIRQVSYNWDSFARCAYKIQVDIDPAELEKPTVRPDLAIVSDLDNFLEEMERQLQHSPNDPNQHTKWVAWCRERVLRYPVVEDRHRALTAEGLINPYGFIERLFGLLDEQDIVVCGNATASVVPFQAGHIRAGQRVFANSGCASMGYDLPAAIGAAIGRPGRRVICLAGDGSLQMNIQEMQTLAHYGLPVKIFVLNNRGYLSMRITQRNFFGRLTGESPESNISFPDYVRVAQAYQIPASRLSGANYAEGLEEVLASDGPVLVDVMLDPFQEFEPKLSARQLPDGRITSPALEDLYPFLSREELESNLLIPPLD